MKKNSKVVTANVASAEAIRSIGLRATRPRVAVLTFLQSVAYPVGIKEISAGLKDTSIDDATIYRTLESFKEAGLVSHVDFRHGCAYYELKDTEHDHHHIVCVGCKKVADFTGCDYSAIIKKALKQARDFVEVIDHSFELFGICNACAKKKTSLQAI